MYIEYIACVVTNYEFNLTVIVSTEICRNVTKPPVLGQVQIKCFGRGAERVRYDLGEPGTGTCHAGWHAICV